MSYSVPTDGLPQKRSKDSTLSSADEQAVLSAAGTVSKNTWGSAKATEIADPDRAFGVSGAS